MPSNEPRVADVWRRQACGIGSTIAAAVAILALTAPAAGMRRGGPVVWTLDNLARIGGHAVTVIGTPRVVSTPVGKAVEFNGATDGLMLDVNPIEGLARFTVEALFEPSPDGPEEQRFLHVSETGSERRLMMETRILPNHSWCLDTYLRMEAPGLTLLDRAKAHPASRWHAASLTFDGRTMTSYVDGVRELSGEVAFEPLKAGRVSIGVRQNLVSWFKGRIRLVRVTPEALPALAKLLVAARRVEPAHGLLRYVIRTPGRPCRSAAARGCCRGGSAEPSRPTR